MGNWLGNQKISIWIGDWRRFIRVFSTLLFCSVGTFGFWLQSEHGCSLWLWILSSLYCRQGWRSRSPMRSKGYLPISSIYQSNISLPRSLFPNNWLPTQWGKAAGSSGITMMWLIPVSLYCFAGWVVAHSTCLHGCSRVSSLEMRLCRDSSLSVPRSGYPIFMRIHESLLLFMRWAGLFGI